MTDNSTPPVNDEKTDTSGTAQPADTSDKTQTTEPAEPKTEPETSTSGAEPNVGDENSQKEELIFGKFKNMEEAQKGYKEAERAIRKAADLEKTLKAYQEREEQAREQREIGAREDGFADYEEQKVYQETKQHEFAMYCQALETRLYGENYNAAYKALLEYQASGKPQDLEKARALFPPEVVAQIAENVAMFRQRHLAERMRALQGKKKEALVKFANENVEWIQPKERQDALGLLIQLSGGNLDFAEAKKAIDALEAAAVSAYQRKTAETQENQNLTNSLQTPSGEPAKTGKKWLTREEYMKMSEAEEAANHDLIVEQVLLEKEGKLPRQLT